MFVCKLCHQLPRYTTEALSDVIAHTASQHGNVLLTRGLFICCLPDCSLAKDTFGEWRNHVARCYERYARRKRKHQGDEVVKIFSCRCGDEFSSSELLSRHVVAHLRLNQLVKCPYGDCSLTFTAKTTFYRHVKDVHHGMVVVPDRVIRVIRDDFDNDLQEQDVAEPFLGADFPAGALVPTDVGNCKNRCPDWFRSNISRFDQEGVCLCVAANALFGVPKSKVRMFLEQCNNFCERWILEPGVCYIDDLLRAHLEPELASKLSEEILQRVVTSLPLRKVFTRSLGRNISSDYRLLKTMKGYMRYVHPVDLATAIDGDPLLWCAPRLIRPGAGETLF